MTNFLNGCGENGARIVKALGLPAGTVEINFRIRAGEAAELTASMYVKDEITGDLVEELKKYILVENEDESYAVEAKQLTIDEH